MGKKTRFNVKPKWLFLFLSLFACAIGAFGGMLSSSLPTGVRGDFSNDYTSSITFDFEETTAHRTSGNNDFGVDEKTYTENGVTITLVYADSITTGSPISDTANLALRVAKNTTNSPNAKIGPINLTPYQTLEGIEYSVKGPSALTLACAYSTNGTTWTSLVSGACPTTAGTRGGNIGIDCSAISSFYVKFTVTVASSTGSNRDAQIDNVSIYLTDPTAASSSASSSSSTPSSSETSSTSPSSSTTSSSSASSESSLSPISVDGWEASEYYSSLVSDGYLAGKSAWALADDIHKIMWATTTDRRSYSSLRDHLQLADVDPSNSSYLLDFWTGQPMLGSGYPTIWNLEHVWPAANSYGAWQRLDSGDKDDKYAGCDIHHIRPSAATVNKTRGNVALGIVDTSKDFDYVTVNGVTSGCKDGLNSEGFQVFEPEDNKKGDVARIFLYLYVTYSTSIEIDGTRSPLTDCTSFDGNYSVRTADLSKVIIDGDHMEKDGTHVDGDASLIDVRGTDFEDSIGMLLYWNELDPVDALESHRNDYAAEMQGNRNPFIDFPDLANYIFDAQGQTFYDMQMDAEQTVLLTAGTLTPTTRTMPSSALASVTYTSSDSTIVSVSGSTISVHKAGSARLTGTVTIGGILTITRTTTVRVVSPITAISLSPSTSSSSRYTLTKGKSFTPVANAVPSDAFDQGMTWTSSNTTVASVDATTGKIKAKTVGTCNITVTSTANALVSSTFYLEVVNAEAGVIDIEADSFDMSGSGYADRSWASGDYSGTGNVNQSDHQLQMKASGASYIYNSGASSDVIEKIIFFSSPTEASRDSDYDVYAATSAMTDSNYTTVGTKIATVSVPTYGGSATCDIGGSYTHFYIATSGNYAHYLARVRLIVGDYTPVLESISLDYSDMKRNYVGGDALDLTGLVVNAVFDDGSTTEVTASCSFSPDHGDLLDTDDASVTVSYTSGSMTLTDDVPIRVDAPKELSSVSVLPSTVSVSAGRTTSLRLKATYADGSTEVVSPMATWTSSDETLATVTPSGVITTIGPGEVTITGSYTYDGVTKSDSSVLTIIESEFAVSATAFTCVFGDDSFTPELVVTYGETDVTDSCTYREPIFSDGKYVYRKTLGVHEFVLTYTAGTTKYRRTISITTTNAGASNPGTATFTQVTSTSGLVAGKSYIIANAATLNASAYVLSTTQNSNNRGQTAYSAGNQDMQILTLGGSAGAWTLYTGDGYLAATGNSKNNYLRTQAELSNNGKWAITFSNGAASIVGQGGNDNETLRHNSTNEIFSCYADSTKQNDVYLFASINPAFTTSEQANALKEYLDTFRTCDVVSETQVRKLALEYNSLNCTTVGGTTSKAVFQTLYAANQFEYGVDYTGGSYNTDTPSGEAILCMEKLEYIVARWNTYHPNNLVYLYSSSYYAGTDNGGSGGEAPILAVSEFAIRYKQEESPLTTTLWIVIGAGMAGMVTIGAAYLASKKKKRCI